MRARCKSHVCTHTLGAGCRVVAQVRGGGGGEEAWEADALVFAVGIKAMQVRGREAYCYCAKMQRHAYSEYL